MKEWMLENLNWFAPLLITILFSALNMIVAICNYRITKHQNKMQNDSFCFQLFEKRQSIFDRLNQILCLAIAKGKVTNEMMLEFKISTKDAKFFFGDDFFVVWQEACKLLDEYKVISYKVENDTLNPNHSDLCDKEAEMLVKLVEQQKLLTNVAQKYISFSAYKIDK